MPEINGNPVAVGDTILVQTQVARVEQYDELADRMTYVIGEGRGVNYVQGHVSNTNFQVIDPTSHAGLAQQQAVELEALTDEVQTIANPVEEDPDTDRVKGDIGAKLPGQPDSGDEVVSG